MGKTKKSSGNSGEEPSTAAALDEEMPQAHDAAATQIQRAWRRYAAQNRVDVDSAQPRHCCQQHMLRIFIAVNAFGFAFAGALLFFILKERILVDAARTSNWALCVVFVAVCGASVLGLHGTRKKSVKVLRSYAFALLLVMCAEISVVSILVMDDILISFDENGAVNNRTVSAQFARCAKCSMTVIIS